LETNPISKKHFLTVVYDSEIVVICCSETQSNMDCVVEGDTSYRCFGHTQRRKSEDQKKELLAEISEGSLIMALAQYEKEVSYLSRRTPG